MRNRFATIVVEPSIFIREGLVRVLGAARFRIVASADCIEDLALESLPKHGSMLLIVGTGENPRSAIRQIELFRKWYPDGRIAVVGGGWEFSDIVSVFRTGAHACFIEVGACDILIKTLELVMLGETVLPSSMLLPYILESSNTPIEPLPIENVGVSTHIDGDGAPILMEAQITFAHRGRIELVEVPGSTHIARSLPNAALLKAVARGYVWFEEITSGRSASRAWDETRAATPAGCPPAA